MGADFWASASIRRRPSMDTATWSGKHAPACDGDWARRDMTTALQQGRWPRLLNRAVAAEYCGVGVDTFNANVDRGALPRPLHLPTGAVLWDRTELDAAIDLLKTGRRPVEEDIGNVRKEYEAFKRERFRGATKRRSQGRLARP